MLYRNLDPSKPKRLREKTSRENLWHADVTYKKAPPRGAVLRCELGPETGGDTMLAAYGIVELQRSGRVALPKLAHPQADKQSRVRPLKGKTG